MSLQIKTRYRVFRNPDDSEIGGWTPDDTHWQTSLDNPRLTHLRGNPVVMAVHYVSDEQYRRVDICSGVLSSDEAVGLGLPREPMVRVKDDKTTRFAAQKDICTYAMWKDVHVRAREEFEEDVVARFPSFNVTWIRVMFPEWDSEQEAEESFSDDDDDEEEEEDEEEDEEGGRMGSATVEAAIGSIKRRDTPAAITLATQTAPLPLSIQRSSSNSSEDAPAVDRSDSLICSTLESNGTPTDATISSYGKVIFHTPLQNAFYNDTATTSSPDSDMKEDLIPLRRSSENLKKLSLERSGNGYEDSADEISAAAPSITKPTKKLKLRINCTRKPKATPTPKPTLKLHPILQPKPTRLSNPNPDPPTPENSKKRGSVFPMGKKPDYRICLCLVMKHFNSINKLELQRIFNRVFAADVAQTKWANKEDHPDWVASVWGQYNQKTRSDSREDAWAPIEREVNAEVHSDLYWDLLRRVEEAMRVLGIERQRLLPGWENRIDFEKKVVRS